MQQEAKRHGTVASTVFALACIAAFCSMANAVPLVDFTFEGDTVGAMPSGWTSGTYDGNPVEAYVTDTTAGAGTQSFYMDDYVGVSQISMRTSFTSQSSGLFHQTGMARVEQDDVSIEPFTLLGAGNRRFNELRFGSDGTFTYENGHGNWVSSGVTYDVGEWYDFDFLINLHVDRWSFSIRDDLGALVASAAGIEFGTSFPTSFFEVRSWGVGFSYTGQWYIDNVRLEAIPEPGTLFLVGCGITALGLRIRSRSRT